MAASPSRTPSVTSTQVGGSHYIDTKVQPWDAMEAWMTPLEFRGFLRGNAIKYLARANKKGAFLQDVLKAQHYLNKLVEYETSHPLGETQAPDLRHPSFYDTDRNK